MARAELGGTPELPGKRTKQQRKQDGKPDLPQRFYKKDSAESQEPPRWVSDAISEGEMRAETEFAREQLQQKLTRVIDPYAARIRHIAQVTESNLVLAEPTSQEERPKVGIVKRTTERFRTKEQHEEPIKRGGVISGEGTNAEFPVCIDYIRTTDEFGSDFRPIKYTQNFPEAYRLFKGYNPFDPNIQVNFNPQQEIESISVAFWMEPNQEEDATVKNKLTLPPELSTKLQELYPDEYKKLELFPALLGNMKAFLIIEQGEEPKAELSFLGTYRPFLQKPHPEDYVHIPLLEIPDSRQEYPTEEESQRLVSLTEAVCSYIPLGI